MLKVPLPWPSTISSSIPSLSWSYYQSEWFPCLVLELWWHGQQILMHHTKLRCMQQLACLRSAFCWWKKKCCSNTYISAYLFTSNCVCEPMAFIYGYSTKNVRVILQQQALVDVTISRPSLVDLFFQSEWRFELAWTDDKSWPAQLQGNRSGSKWRRWAEQRARNSHERRYHHHHNRSVFL